VHEEPKLTETEKGETSEETAKSMLIIFFDFKGIVHKVFILAGQTQFGILL
jgi:hypothetical protein